MTEGKQIRELEARRDGPLGLVQHGCIVTVVVSHLRHDANAHYRVFSFLLH